MECDFCRLPMAHYIGEEMYGCTYKGYVCENPECIQDDLYCSECGSVKAPDLACGVCGLEVAA